MTDERLAEIRLYLDTYPSSSTARTRMGGSHWGPGISIQPPTMEELLAVVDEYKQVIDLHHADFVKIKRKVQWALSRLTVRGRLPQSWVAETFQEIDRIVR